MIDDQASPQTTSKPRKPAKAGKLDHSSGSAQIVCRSQQMRQLLASAQRVAPSRVAVLIQGESGTGKELVARSVHTHSGREGKFIALNCAAVPASLFESELFGHERGAFTSANSTKVGAFERAHHGTLFLDEIGDLQPEQQAKLLRALQEGEVQRIGGDSPIKVDVRIVAATHRDLETRASNGTFRDDLYYRLAGYTLHLPPLRGRRADIVPIAQRLLATEFLKKVLSREAQAVLLHHDWPGNVRELQNVVRASAIDARGNRITAEVVRQHLKLPVKPLVTTDRLDGALAFISQRGSVTSAELCRDQGLTKTTAHRLLSSLMSKGLVRRIGEGRESRYVSPATNARTFFSERQKKALTLARERGRFSRRDYEDASGLPSRTAKRDLAELVESGLLRMEGNGKRATYVLLAPDQTAG